MRLISETLGVDPTFQMAVTAATKEDADPKAKKQTPGIMRTPLQELELIYIHDTTVFNSINKIKQTIMSAVHMIKAKDKKVLEFTRNFVHNLGNSGSLITWEEILSRIFLHQCIYGRAWVENVFNKKGNRIVDWDMVDPKTMDYAKDSSERIVLDSLGRAVGYTQTLSTYYSHAPNTNAKKAPSRVTLQPNQTFIDREKIALINLYTVGDGFYGLGLIEPTYANSIRKQNVEEALANAIWRHGFPIYWAQLGDLQHEPTPQQVQTMLDKLKSLTFKKEIATPYYYNLSILQAKQTEKLQDHLDYFQDQQITGMGIPKPYATGSGEATNRATLNNMSDLFQLTLRDIIKNTTEAIEQLMFKPLIELEGFKEVPRLDWDMVGIDEIDRKSKRILSYIKAGLLPVDMKIQDYIKKVEDLED